MVAKTQGKNPGRGLRKILRAPTPVLVKPEDHPQMRHWVGEYLKEQVYGVGAQETVEAKQRDLKQWLEWWEALYPDGRLAHWVRRDTENFKQALVAQGYQPASVNRMLATVKHFAGYLVNRGLFPQGSPVYGVKNVVPDKLKPRGLSQREVNWLLKASDLLRRARGDDFASVRNQAILLMLLHTGLRVSELCGLEMGQLDGKWLRNVKGKGHTVREVFLPAELRAVLAEYLPRREQYMEQALRGFAARSPAERHRLQERLAARVPEGRFLFLNRYGSRLTRQAVAQLLHTLAAFARAQFQAEVKVHPHAFRHTFALNMLERAGEAFAADRLGHRSLHYVRVYTQRDEAAIERIMEGNSAR